MKGRNIIVSGGPGAGKTTLIEALAAAGFATKPEVSRALIREQQASGGRLYPWVDMEGFARECERRMRADLAASADGVVRFFDRGLPDIIGYLRHRDIAAWTSLSEGLEAYAPVVLMAPPWEEIFTHDPERPQGYDESVAIHQRLVEAYQAAGFAIREIPRVPIAGRVEWVRKEIAWAG